MGEFLNVMVQILEALEYFHRTGIIFGDLKPDNLLFDPDRNRIVFADFGDARLVSEAGKRCLDPHAMGWGNPSYHAKPDVMAMSLSVKSDMWMLAQTAVHLWTGAQPMSNPAQLPADIPLKALLKDCLSQQGASRPDASSMLQEVRRMAVKFAPSKPVPQRKETTRKMQGSPPRTFGKRIDTNLESPEGTQSTSPSKAGPCRSPQPYSTCSSQENGEKESTRNATTFRDFNKRLDALKARVIGDEDAWQKLNRHAGMSA